MSLDPSLGYNDEEKRFSKHLVKYWTNFVKYGDPNIYDLDDKDERNTIWPLWNNKQRNNNSFKPNTFYETYLSLRPNNLKITNDSSFLHCNFWRQYSNYPTAEKVARQRQSRKNNSWLINFFENFLNLKFYF